MARQSSRAARDSNFTGSNRSTGPSLLLKAGKPGSERLGRGRPGRPRRPRHRLLHPANSSPPRRCVLPRSPGVALVRQGEFDNALRDYDEAIRLDPRNATLSPRPRAWPGITRKSTTEAIADFDEAIRLDPKFARCVHRPRSRRSATNRTTAWPSPILARPSGSILWRSPPTKAGDVPGKPRKSSPKPSSTSASLFGSIPERVATYCDRGDAWAALRKFDKAIADFNAAVQIDKKCARAYGCLAWIWSTCPDARLP